MIVNLKITEESYYMKTVYTKKGVGIEDDGWLRNFGDNRTELWITWKLV